MPSMEESFKMLVRALIHDVRNQINGMVLELTDLRERWPDSRVTKETASLMRQTMEIADRLKDIRERLEPASPQKQSLTLAKAWRALAPDAKPVAGAASGMEIELDPAQIQQALKELVANAVEGGNPDAVPIGRVERGQLVIVIENPSDTAPDSISQWGSLPGYTTKRRHLGLGCSYIRSVVLANGGEVAWHYDAAPKMVRAEVRLPLAG